MDSKRKLVKRAELTAKKVKEWRAKVGMTQVDAANWFGVHPRTYQGWEEGRREFHRDDMIRELMDKARRKKERQDKAKADQAQENLFDKRRGNP